MEITYHGGNCVSITNKKTRVVVDDNLGELGLKSITQDGDILLLSNPGQTKKPKAKFVSNLPGEYEVSNVSIRGIAARSHIAEKDNKDSIIYKLIINDLRIGILGHIYPSLDDNQLEALGTIDVLIVPVGGGGYTLDGTGAISLIKKIEPKIIIPTHYKDSGIKYPVPQADLETALKAMSLDVSDTLDSYKPKGLETIENTRLIVLNRK